MIAPMPMARIIALTGLLLAPSVFAIDTCSATGKYIAIPNFVEPKACIPSGYYQAQDLGQTNPQALTSSCETQCLNYGTRCAAFVGQLQKAADSNLYTGQCFYYDSPPTAPTYCEGYPTVIIAEQKDTAPSCFAASAVAATAYCSSYLSIGVVTVYTSTYTPSATTTKTTFTTKSTTSSVSTTTTTTTTSISTSTAPEVTSTSISTVDVTTTTSTTSTSTSFLPQGLAGPSKRAITSSPAPSCLPLFEPAASISSACSCLSITSKTVFAVSTTKTKTKTSTKTSTRTSTSLTTSTETSTSVTLTTVTTTPSTATTTTLTTTVSTETDRLTSSTVLPYPTACPLADNTVYVSAGKSFTRRCNVISTHGSVSLRTSAASFDACIDLCATSTTLSCVLAQYSHDTGQNCLLYQQSDKLSPPFVFVFATEVDSAYIAGFVPSA